MNLTRNAAEAARLGRQVAARENLRDHGRTRRTAAGSASASSDNGPGIPERDLPKIFLPFYTTKSDGTGLGLAVVQKVALQHGGSIEARNRPDGGAEFILWLPLRQEPVAIGYSPPRLPASRIGQAYPIRRGGVAMRRILPRRRGSAACLRLVRWIGAQAQQQDQTSSQASQTAARLLRRLLRSRIRWPRLPAKRANRRKTRRKPPRFSQTTIFRRQGGISTVGTSDADASQNAQDTSNARQHRPRAATTRKRGATNSRSCTTSSSRIRRNSTSCSARLGTGSCSITAAIRKRPCRTRQAEPLGSGIRQEISEDRRQEKARSKRTSKRSRDAEDELRKAGGDPGWAR